MVLDKCFDTDKHTKSMKIILCWRNFWTHFLLFGTSFSSVSHEAEQLDSQTPGVNAACAARFNKKPPSPDGNGLHINQFKRFAGVTLGRRRDSPKHPRTPLDPLRQGPTGIQTAE